MEQQNSEPIPKPRSAWAIIISIALTALIVGGGVFAWQKSIFKSSEQLLLQQITHLQDQVKQLGQNESQTDEKNQPCPESPAEAEKPSKTPVILFNPATFSEEEKSELLSKIINPYLDFQKDANSSNAVSISITKYQEGATYMGSGKPEYMYNIEAIFENGGYSGWLERKFGTPIQTWVPDCMDKCNFSEQYKNKYPETVAKYNEMNK